MNHKRIAIHHGVEDVGRRKEKVIFEKCTWPVATVRGALSSEHVLSMGLYWKRAPQSNNHTDMMIQILQEAPSTANVFGLGLKRNGYHYWANTKTLHHDLSCSWTTPASIVIVRILSRIMERNLYITRPHQTSIRSNLCSDRTRLLSDDKTRNHWDRAIIMDWWVCDSWYCSCLLSSLQSPTMRAHPFSKGIGWRKGRPRSSWQNACAALMSALLLNKQHLEF